MVLRATYENGRFVPTGPVDLPDGCVVEFEPRPVDGVAPLQGQELPPALLPGDPRLEGMDPALARIYLTLGRRFDGGQPGDILATHADHQP